MTHDSIFSIENLREISTPNKSKTRFDRQKLISDLETASKNTLYKNDFFKNVAN